MRPSFLREGAVAEGDGVLPMSPGRMHRSVLDQAPMSVAQAALENGGVA